MSWTSDPRRVEAFRELTAAMAAADTYTAAVEAAAPPIARGLGAAVVIGLLDGARDVVHALGIHDPDLSRFGILEELFAAPFERRGVVGRALADGESQRTEVDDDYIRDHWPEHAEITERFELRYVAVAPLRTRGDVSGVILGARNELEGPFSEDDTRFMSECGLPLALAVHNGYLQEALQRTAGRRAAVVEPDGRPAGGERRRETLLSERERAVLGLLAAGRTNREIGDALSLSTRTVEWHRARIQWKLGVSGREDLTRAAQEHGV